MLLKTLPIALLFGAAPAVRAWGAAGHEMYGSPLIVACLTPSLLNTPLNFFFLWDKIIVI
jgi:hypothetical protein